MLIILLTVVGVIVATVVGATPAKPKEFRLATIKQSPQWRNGKFNNELERHSESIWRMIGERFRSKTTHRAPKSPVPKVSRSSEGFRELPASGLRVTWLGHSSVLVEIDDYRVLTDPVWSERASPFTFAGPKRFFAPPLPIDQLPDLDVVVISHDHFDHLDKQTIIALKDRVPLFAVPLGVGAHLESWGVDPAKIAEADWWGDIKVGELILTATPARHFSGRSLTSVYQDKTLWSGWSIAGPKHRVYYSGDTAMFPGFTEIGQRLGPFDLTMIEVGAYNAMWPDVHIGPEQAIEAHRMVRGKRMLPVHWGTFDLADHNWTEPAERVIAAAEKADVEVVIPKPGQSFEPDLSPKIARWWPELPWQTAEQAPVISTGLGSEVAKLNNKAVFEVSQ